MIRKITKIFFVLFFFVSLSLQAQIGAEAQGGKTSLWTALGIDLEMSSKWSAVTDLGFGRHSDPDNNKFLKRQGLNVLTQDFIYKANEHWYFSFSLGYWRRSAYQPDSPYDERHYPYEFRNELRPYQRIHYNHSLGNIKISHVFRTDYRFYYNQDFSGAWNTPFEFRARYLQTWRIPMTINKKNWFIASDEILTAVDQNSEATKASTGKGWSPYQITENRLSVYYRRTLFADRVYLDLGIMHQYWREKPGISNFNVSYNLMFDVIIIDPFGKKEKHS